jgi:hypothetical protein
MTKEKGKELSTVKLINFLQILDDTGRGATKIDRVLKTWDGVLMDNANAR